MQGQREQQPRRQIQRPDQQRRQQPITQPKIDFSTVAPKLGDSGIPKVGNLSQNNRQFIPGSSGMPPMGSTGVRFQPPMGGMSTRPPMGQPSMGGPQNKMPPMGGSIPNYPGMPSMGGNPPMGNRPPTMGQNIQPLSTMMNPQMGSKLPPPTDKKEEK